MVGGKYKKQEKTEWEEAKWSVDISDVIATKVG